MTLEIPIPPGPEVRSEPPAAIRSRSVSPFMAAITSGLLLWLAFPPADRGYLGWFALVPIFTLAASSRPRWQVYLAAWLGGLLFWHLATSWVNLAADSAWLGWTIMATFLSLGWLLFLAIARFGTRGLGLPLVVAAPVAWLVEEYYRAFTMTGFPWYYMAHSQYRSIPLIQVADLGGVWAVSLVVLLVNAALAELLLAVMSRPEGSRLSAIPRPLVLRTAGVAGVLIVTLGYGAWRLSTARFEAGPKLALLQSDIEQELKMSHDSESLLAAFRHLVELSLPERPDLIVWPETAYPRGYPIITPGLDPALFDRQIKAINPAGTILFWRQKELLVRRDLHEWTDRIGVPMVVGSTLYEFKPDGLGRFNSAILFQPGGKPITAYHKLHLVPFGEYVPLLKTFPWLTALTPYDPDFVPSLVPGPGPLFFELGGVRYTTAICFEDTVPYVVRRSFAGRRAGDQPDVLLNLSNDGWFRGSSEIPMHLAASVFRAVENRVPIARAVNTGGTSVVDGNGRIVRQSPLSRFDALIAAVPLDPRTTLYSQTGDWLPQLAVAAVLASFLIRLGRSHRYKRVTA